MMRLGPTLWLGPMGKGAAIDGKEFNPKEHHSVGKIDVNDKEKDNIILEELQKGYKLKEKIIRPSQVKVGSYKN